MDDHTRRGDVSLYDTDFYSWTQEQAALLKEGRASSADLAHIVEELETLGRSELNALISAYKLVAHHLLKMIHQPNMATPSWEATIKRERGAIEDILEDNPGLRAKQDEAFAKGYARGRRDAANETGIDIARFPETPEFTRAEAEAKFWPEGFPRPSTREAVKKAGKKTPRRE